MWYLYILAGLLSGIVGGMGMGGGTLLIPILTLCLGVSQHIAQGVNLLVFIPMGLVAIIIHLFNHLIDFRVFLLLIIPALVSSIVASNFSNGLETNTLKTIFAVFLIVVGCYEFGVAINKTINKKKPVLKNKIKNEI